MSLYEKISSTGLAVEQKIFRWLARLDEGSWTGREWRLAILIGVFAWASSMLLYSPAIWTLMQPGRIEQSRAGDFLRLCANPLTRDLREPILAFRPVTPLLCWLLRLPRWGCLVLPYLFTIGTLACICRTVARRVDNASGVLATLAVALSWTVVWPNTKLGMPDGVTHFATAVCLLTGTPGWWIAMTIAGTLNDERFMLAIPFVLLWHAWPAASMGEAWRKTWKLLLAFGAGLLVVMLIRHALKVGWIGSGITIEQDYTNAQRFRTDLSGWLREEGFICLANTMMAWRWLWLVWLAALCAAWRQGVRWWAGLVASGLFAVVIASSFVADVSRSIGFAFPAVLGVWLAAEKLRPEAARRWLWWGVLLCVVTPNFYFTDHVQWSRPLPLSVLRWLTGWDLLTILH